MGKSGQRGKLREANDGHTPPGWSKQLEDNVSVRKSFHRIRIDCPDLRRDFRANV